MRPITIVVPFGPGGIADLSAGAVAQAMSRQLKQPIVFDNRPNAGAIAVGSTRHLSAGRFRQRTGGDGVLVPHMGTPAQMRARLEREIAHRRQVITTAKIEPE